MHLQKVYFATKMVGFVRVRSRLEVMVRVRSFWIKAKCSSVLDNIFLLIRKNFARVCWIASWSRLRLWFYPVSDWVSLYDYGSSVWQRIYCVTGSSAWPWVWLCNIDSCKTLWQSVDGTGPRVLGLWACKLCCVDELLRAGGVDQLGMLWFGTCGFI